MCDNNNRMQTSKVMTLEDNLTSQVSNLESMAKGNLPKDGLYVPDSDYSPMVPTRYVGAKSVPIATSRIVRDYKIKDEIKPARVTADNMPLTNLNNSLLPGISTGYTDLFKYGYGGK